VIQRSLPQIARECEFVADQPEMGFPEIETVNLQIPFVLLFFSSVAVAQWQKREMRTLIAIRNWITSKNTISTR